MNEIEQYLAELLDRIRRNDLVRMALAWILILLLLGLAGKFAYELMPRKHSLTITGGSLLSQRHFLARILEEEAYDQGVSLKIVPVSGSLEALDLVDEGKLDLAFIQGGLDPAYENVRHVATVSPEIVHFLVKPGVEDVADIRGKSVNMGVRNGAVSVIAHQVLQIAGLVPNVDYVEINYRDHELVELPREHLPDVIAMVSYAPSDLVEFLVQHRGYRVLEMAFPPSLSKKLGWVGDSKILGYMYSIIPPIPPRDIQVVGVKMHLVASKEANPRAVAKVLETLYDLRVAARFGQPLSEDDLMLSSGFPVSEGTLLYLARKQPLIDQAMFDKLKALAGLLMTIGSLLLVIFKWFRAPEHEPEHAPDGADKRPQGGAAPAEAPGLAEPINNLQEHLAVFNKD
ncbi:MAG: TAXI family TRAP transporter solute-binding subunit [Burkholderiales bacterium]